jgi:hypothetical protein
MNEPTLETAMQWLNRWMMRWVRPLTTVLGLLGLAAALILYLLGFHVRYVMSDIILGATALIVLAYTLETQGLRQQMVRQYALDVRPLVLMRIGETAQQGKTVYTVTLENIGRSPALSIQISPFEIDDFRQLGTEYPIVQFSLVDCLGPGATTSVEEVDLWKYPDGHIDAGQSYIELPSGNRTAVSTTGRYKWIKKLIPGLAEKNYILPIRYSDVDGGGHASLMQHGKEGAKLLSHT